MKMLMRQDPRARPSDSGTTTGGKGDRLIAAVLEGGANGYDTACLLRDHGITTFLLSPQELRDGKYPGIELLRSPSPEEPENLTAFLNETVAPGQNVVLLAASDRFTLFLAHQRDQLEERFLYLLPDAALTEALDNKMLFYELCHRNGIPYPKTVIVAGKGEFESALGAVSFPSIVKPFRSRDWPQALGNKVQIVRTAEELLRLVPAALSYGCEVIIQDLIPGGAQTDFMVGGLYNEGGNPVRLYVGQKILQNPLDVGAGCHVHLSWNEGVVVLANAFAKSTGYCGLVDMDIKYDPRDSGYKLIEVNPRNGLWHRCSSDGRWDISSYYVHWISGRADVVEGYKAHEDGRKWIHPHMHLCSRIEENGLLRGTALWLKEMHQTKLRCAWDFRDLRRSWRCFRTVVGHVRRLSLRTLLFGREPRRSRESPVRPGNLVRMVSGERL